MKLPENFPEWDDLLERMGIPYRPFVDPEIEESMITEGITVEFDDFIAATDGTLEYQGRKVVLYIRDVKGSLPKYHVVNCQTLKSMQSAGKHKRYVVTRRTDGEFILNFSDNLSLDKPETHKLDICKHCLSQLNLKHIYSPDAFPLADWFNAIDPGYEPPPIDGLYGPITTRVTDPVSNYPPDWNLRSLQCRERAEWKCEKCGINLKSQSKFLHAHHLKGTMYNQPEDLQALCIGCHAKKPGEGHRLTKDSPDYEKFMDKYGHIWKQLTEK